MNATGRMRGYSWEGFRKDLISGLIVGIIAIPLGMAFSIASGVKPEYGIYTTIIAGIAIALFGGSRFQIGGPTGAFIPILFMIVMQYGYDNLLIAGFMAGIMLTVMGLLRLGALIKFIPKPVTIGFTAGIAVIIFSGQIGSFLGLKGVVKHNDFLPNMLEIGKRAGTVNLYSVIIATICLLCILITPHLFRKIPGSLVGLIVSGIAAAVFMKGKVDTIGSVYGPIPSQLPHFYFPSLTFDHIESLIVPALIIAMLGSIESLLSAIVADGMTSTRHNSNRELIGQGIANMLAPLFGGIPATGAIARTATNIRNGAVSPVAAIIHSITVLFVLLLFAPYASRIPLASMAPVLMMVAWNMSERKELIHLLKLKTSDSLVVLITFLLTVFTTLTTAVVIGLVCAVVFFLKRMSEVMTIVKVLPDPNYKGGELASHRVSLQRDCPQISIYKVEGPLFFGAAQLFENAILTPEEKSKKLLILRMNHVPFMDTTGTSHLATVVKRYAERGGQVYISGMKGQPRESVEKAGILHQIGKENFFEHTGEALHRALGKLDRNTCIGCRHYAFRECDILSAGHKPNTGVE